MRYPTIQGDTIVFTYAQDLWVAKTGGGLARRLTSSNGQEVRAKISPDGTTVAFTGTYDGNADVYTIPIEGGEPKRLTYEPDPDLVLNWTPDGKIAYSSTAGSFTNRQPRLWEVDPKGGLPIRTAIAEVSEVSFFPDGQSMAYTRVNSYGFNWRRYRGGTQGRIGLYNFAKNTYEELPTGREQNYYPMVVAGDVYYVSDRNQGTLNLYRYDLDSKKEVQLTKYDDADIRYPSTDGKSIVWERDGYLYQYDLAKNEAKKLAPKIASENLSARPYLRNVANQITSLALSPSGARVVVEARGDLYSIPAKQGDTRNMTNSSGARDRFPTWSPDGQTIAYVSDASGEYEVYTRPAKGGDPVQLTKSGLPIVSLDYSPDGKKLLVQSDKNDTYILDIATKAMTKVVQSKYGASGFEWSPDGRWISFADTGTNEFSSIKLYEVATGKTTQVTDGRYRDDNPTWDLNGKYLYFKSLRNFNPSFGAYEFSLKVENEQRIYVIPLSNEAGNPLLPGNDEEPDAPKDKPAGPPAGGPPPGMPGAGGPPPSAEKPPIRVDVDGMAERTIPLPLPPNGIPFILGARNGVFFYADGVLGRFDMDSREVTPIFNGFAGQLSFNAARTKLAYAQGPILGVVDVRPGITPGQGRVDTSTVDMVIDPRAEWKQMLWETWRFVRDHYYDEGMRGYDWKAIGQRYEGYLAYVNHRADLNYVIGLMIGELGTGHSYVRGGDMGPGPTPIPTGNLGADYERSGNFIKFKRIYRGDNYDETRRGPLGEPGVKVNEGEYLLAIDGKPVTAADHPAELLTGKVGRFVTLSVNTTPNLATARTIRVRPIASEANLRYITFVEDNRRYVEKMSGGRIGYMHIPNTAAEGSTEIVRGFYSQTDKDAVVVDERWNGGGYIQPWFVDTLARKSRAGIQVRNAGGGFDAVSIEGPKVMLINGYAGSGGDFFPWMFRQAKLGPLIGTRTWGGLVGIGGGVNLVDGGNVTAPEFAIYDRETGRIIAENTGVDPDIEVDARPDLVALGRDPQLEKAVAVLMEELKKLPAKKTLQGVPIVGDQGKVVH